MIGPRALPCIQNWKHRAILARSRNSFDVQNLTNLSKKKLMIPKTDKVPNCIGTHFQMRKIDAKKRTNCVSNPFVTEALTIRQKHRQWNTTKGI